MKQSEEESKSDALPNSSAEPQLRILVVINEPKNLDGALSYLKARDFSLSFVSNLGHMVLEIQNFKPSIILLSWNLKNTPVEKAYRVLTHKFNLACIVFAEEAATHTLNRLFRTEIPNPVTPPITGPNLVMRIRSLLAKRHRPPMQMKITKKDLSRDMQWEQVEDAENGKEKLWQGLSKKNESKGIYYFRGPEKPKFDLKKQEWDIKESSELYLQEKASETQSPLLNDKNLAQTLEAEFASLTKTEPQSQELEIEKSAPPDMGTDVLHFAKPKLNENEFSAEKGVLESPTGRLDRNSLLAQALQRVIEKTPSPILTPFEPSQPIYKVFVFTINSPRFSGYMALACSENSFILDDLKDIDLLLKDEMKVLGEPLSEDTDFFEIPIHSQEFRLWAETLSDFYFVFEEKGLALAFFSALTRPQIFNTEDSQMLGISLKQYLKPNTACPFDLFLQLTENKKFLRYLSAGQVFTLEMSSKFDKFQIPYLYIKTADREAFLAYCARLVLDPPKK